MNEARLYEKIGRLQQALDDEQELHEANLKVFAEVITGVCDPRRILINLTNRQVTWAAPGERPAGPPVINGLPVCFTAPPDSEKPAEAAPELQAAPAAA